MFVNERNFDMDALKKALKASFDFDLDKTDTVDVFFSHMDRTICDVRIYRDGKYSYAFEYSTKYRSFPYNTPGIKTYC